MVRRLQTGKLKEVYRKAHSSCNTTLKYAVRNMIVSKVKESNNANGSDTPTSFIDEPLFPRKITRKITVTGVESSVLEIFHL